MNSAIADEGLRHAYGAQVGRTILEVYGNGVKARAKARAAAGSDARMGGCPLPVVINSGSGNQGMTVSCRSSNRQGIAGFPREAPAGPDCQQPGGRPPEKIHREPLRLLRGGERGLRQRRGHYLSLWRRVSGGSRHHYQHHRQRRRHCLRRGQGLLRRQNRLRCGRRHPGALLGCRHCTFRPGEGLVQENVEETIENVGYIGRVGMKETDTEILRLMIDREEQAGRNPPDGLTAEPHKKPQPPPQRTETAAMIFCFDFYRQGQSFSLCFFPPQALLFRSRNSRSSTSPPGGGEPATPLQSLPTGRCRKNDPFHIRQTALQSDTPGTSQPRPAPAGIPLPWRSSASSPTPGG